MKILGKSLLGIGIASVSLLSHAQVLNITNNTNEDSTCVVNGICSTAFDGGVTRAHTTNHISEEIMQLACMGTPENCIADVYMTADCSGPKAATAYFSVTRGVVRIDMATNAYQVIGGGFDLIIQPATARK